jgi:nucleoid-associated protein YgaU
MAVTTNKAVLFLLGGVAAAAVVAYGAGMFGPPKQPETIAALPEAGQADKKDARLPEADQPADEPAAALQPPAQPAAPESSTPAAPEAAPPAPAAPESAGEPPPVVPPSFDVVRVEGDGSIVIAGMAAPAAKVDLLVGSNLIGSATAGVDGTFAVVLDDPLKPGDYQIVLRATAPDNVVAMSVETAVVSVPETPDGQVLALVEEPGKPSQMITLPAPQAPAAAAKPPQAAAPPAAETPAAVEAPAAAEPKPEGEMQAALPQEAKPAAPAPPPPAGPAVRVDAVEIDGRKIFVAGAAEPGRTVRGYANQILLGDAKVSPDGSYLIEAERDLPVGDYIIRIDALEPDGVKVAARAAVPFEREPGETIAAVAPQAPVTTPATEAPAAAAAPAKGTDTGGGAPATAAPPVTADAPVAAAPATEGTDTGGGAPAAPAAPAQTSPAPQAPAAAAGEPGTQTPPATEAPAAADAASSATAPAAEPPAATATPPAAEPPAATAEAPAAKPAATDTQTGAAEAPAAGAPAQETPASPPAVAEAPATETPAAEPPPVPAAPPAGAATATDAPEAAPPAAVDTETDIAAAPAENGALPEPPAAGVSEVLAPKLQSAGGAVIIRRGDTLWRISRRVYGRGVRYSTIYLANQSQIEDPDRIWPGQVFKVPEKSADGEAEADYSTLGNRLTTAPEQGAE